MAASLQMFKKMTRMRIMKLFLPKAIIGGIS